MPKENELAKAVKNQFLAAFPPRRNTVENEISQTTFRSNLFRVLEEYRTYPTAISTVPFPIHIDSIPSLNLNSYQ